MSQSSAAQSNYQVRFDWGHEGAAAVGQDADAIVWVSQLLQAPGPADAVAGELERAAELGAWALSQQQALGGPFRIAVVADAAAAASGDW